MSVPDGLGQRGQQLWEETERSTALDPAGRVLLEEACRCADRLQRLHQLLAGDGAAWAVVTLVGDQGGVEATLRIDGVLAEARAQQTVLRGLLGHLRIGRGSAHGAASSVSPAAESTKGGGLDDLGAARARRRAAAAAADGTSGEQ